MPNVTSNNGNLITPNSIYLQGTYPCITCGFNNCVCNTSVTTTTSTLQFCSICSTYYSGSHTACSNNVISFYGLCATCGMSYNKSTVHYCGVQTTLQSSISGTWNWGTALPTFINVKELATELELIYEWNGSTFDLKLPAKFSDCLLKVGYSWVPLYPLIFSAVKDGEKEISFHLVVGVIDKTFEGDKVVLKSVTTTKIEDNLTLLQLCNRTKEYFKDDTSR